MFRVGLDGDVTRLTAAGAYRNLALSPDGTTVFAIRSHINEPPAPVALDIDAADQEPRALATPCRPAPPTRPARGGHQRRRRRRPVHSWLVLPAEPRRRARCPWRC